MYVVDEELYISNLIRFSMLYSISWQHGKASYLYVFGHRFKPSTQYGKILASDDVKEQLTNKQTCFANRKD